jgi:hypothetical protein
MLFVNRGSREREWEYNGGCELVQGTPYTCVEFSQSNPSTLLMYDNSKIKKEQYEKIVKQ